MRIDIEVGTVEEAGEDKLTTQAKAWAGVLNLAVAVAIAYVLDQSFPLVFLAVCLVRGRLTILRDGELYPPVAKLEAMQLQPIKP